MFPVADSAKPARLLATSLAAVLIMNSTSTANATVSQPNTGAASHTVQPAVAPAHQFFPLTSLRLLDGPFRKAMELDQKYLLALDADRLLAGFRANAGLREKAKAYGGWESRGLSGQTLGHYLTALSLMRASTGDQRFLDRLNYCIDELAACQAAVPDGFLGGMPRGREMFAELAAGDIRVKGGFDLNGGWVPWYNQHKLFAGLRDAWELAGSDKARATLIRLGDWCESVCAKLDDRQMQQMLSVEQGGMMETLADLYAITGDAKYLTLARRFWHKAVLDPLADGQDRLTGLHANTNIPKVIGAARLYELTGEPRFKAAADHFWTVVAAQRSFATGSNSDHEHFFKLGLEAGKLGPQNGETCNVYNMLKLTGHRVGWGEVGPTFDFYERALFNHILGSIDPDSGMCTYFQSLEGGRFKVYSTPYDSFWCCTGTGLENHAKYPQHAYSHTGDTLQVNLFMASELTWAVKGLVLRQETDFPRKDSTVLKLKLSRPTPLKLQIRVPGWATQGISVTGATTATAKPGDGYLTLDRIWNDGDTLTVNLPMQLSIHRAVDDPTTVAFLYGPVVLAGQLGRENFPPSDNVPNQTSFDNAPTPEVPVMVTTDTSLAWLKPVPGKPLHFQSDYAGRPAEVQFAPFADIHHQRYAVYFRMMSEPQYAKMLQQMAAERAARQELQARTVDEIRFGEQQSEKDHDIRSEQSFTGAHAGKTWRDARDGGFFTVTAKVNPGVPQLLRCTYWGSDTGNRVFDIRINGKLIQTQRLTAQHPDTFFDVDYPLPPDLLGEAQSIEITFKAHPDSTAGGLFGCRVLTAAPK